MATAKQKTTGIANMGGVTATDNIGGLVASTQTLGGPSGPKTSWDAFRNAAVGLGKELTNAFGSAIKSGSLQQPSSGGYGYLSGGYSSYGGGGGGGGSTGPTKEQKAAAKALGGLAAKQAQATKDKFSNVKDALDMANDNAKKTMEANGHVIGRASSAEWYHNALENPQKIAKAMVDRAGNALSGSMRLSFMDDFLRVFDDATVAAITSELQQKNDNIYEYVQAVNKNINELNKMAADTESSLAQGAADYISQLINIHPDLVNGKEKGFSKLVDTKVFDKDASKLTTDKAASSIKIPTSLAYSGYYNANKKNQMLPDYLTQVREANAIGNAAKKGLYAGATNVASAANPEYLKALTTPYGQRNH